MSIKSPIVMITSYPPRLCGIATFSEEAREFIQKRFPDREVLVISHTDGSGEGVYPLIDMRKADWWKPVADKVNELRPYVVHIEHEYGLYNFVDERGIADNNRGFISLLEAISNWPIVVEPHTVHGRLRDAEADFLYQLANRIDILVLKCDYQKWRLDWTFPSMGWEPPKNIVVIPHGARSDKSYDSNEIMQIRNDIGFDNGKFNSNYVVGLVGWIQSNKRWDIVTSMWKDINDEIYNNTGERWTLLAAGAMRDPDHQQDYLMYKEQVKELEQKGIAHYYEFIPRGEIYYKVMAACDFIILPSIDETQSGTLARIIALNKPYITTAPMEGLTSQTLESEGGLLFTNRNMLRKNIVKLASNQDLRNQLSENLENYLKNFVSWEVVADKYAEAYELASKAKKIGIKASISSEF